MSNRKHTDPRAGKRDVPLGNGGDEVLAKVDPETGYRWPEGYQAIDEEPEGPDPMEVMADAKAAAAHPQVEPVFELMDLPPKEQLRSMVASRSELFVMTDGGVYRLCGHGALVRVPFLINTDDEDVD